MASTSTSGGKRKAEVMDAFDGIAPSASTSASKLMKKASYDVFINHRGPDVKSTLASDLYGILTGMQLSIFLDSEELDCGDFFPQTLAAVMNSALLHIAIFSKSYAQSPWCLAELSFIVKSGVTIIPVFYYVDPSDLRWVDKGKGMYAQAFKEYEQKSRYLDHLEEWKKALHVVSFYTGEVIQNKDDEDRVLKNIVNTVVRKIKNVSLKVAKHPVGLEEIVKDFEMNTIQSVESDQDVQIIGIWGMGGSGKTTLAKEFYNKRSSWFEWSSFVFDVRDASTKGLLYKKQEKIITDLGFQNGEFDNVEDGKRTLSRHLRSVKVLIVLDDVDNVDQLDALLIVKDRLERGSLIIVTTREYDVLESWGITSIYKMKALNPLYAKQLFCWHAFIQDFPQNGFEELVEKFLEACHGLPLSLMVVGAQLYRKSRKEYWESLLHKITRILPIDIQKILKLSYDALDEEEKEMFLDAACFFIGEKYTLPIEVWNGLGQSGLHTWERLLNKCLVECDDYNYIRMHDHIRDLGRHIATTQSPYRFWLHQPIINLQNEKEKRIGIRGIIMTSNRVDWVTYAGSGENIPVMTKNTGEIDEFRVWCLDEKLMINTNCGIWPLSPSLVGLKFLVVSGHSFNQVMGEVSRELVWFRWFQIGQRNLPSGLPLKNLRVLELYEYKWGGEHHLEELWGETDGEASRVRFTCFKYIFQSFYICFVLYISLFGNVLQAPVQVRELIISNCLKFQGFPKSIGHLEHLKKIVIVSRNNVTSLPEEFCFLQSLEHLELYECKILSLPSNFGNLSNLRHLSLCKCEELRSLPVSFKNLMLLEYLNLEWCRQLTFMPEDLNIMENMTKIEYLNLQGCKGLKELPRHITNQAFLRELDFSGTSLRELPDNIGRLSKLRRMAIEKVLSTSLLTSLGGLSSLMELCIRNCPNLECVPDSLGDLSVLTNLEITDCPKLDRLGVASLPKAIRQLSNLQRLKIYSCPISNTSLSFGSSNLKYIEVRETEVCRISCSEDSCPHLERLGVFNNHYLEEIEALPRTLKSISLDNCEMLKSIPSFARLTSLREFCLCDCCKIQKIEGIENCTGLTRLSIDTCWELPGIESLEPLHNLKELELIANNGSVIQRCVQSIQKWPDTITIFARAAPDAASLVDSLLSPSLEIVESISNQKIKSGPKLVSSSHGDTFMVCLVINCLSSQMTVCIEEPSRAIFGIKYKKGRWAWVSVFTPRSQHEFNREEELCIKQYGEFGEGDEVEKGLVVRGDEQTIMEALRSLLPVFQSR